MVQSLWETVWRFPKKLKVELWSNNVTPGHIPRQNIIQKDICTPRFTAALFTIARHGNKLNALQQIAKRRTVRIHNGVLLSPKEGRKNAICSNMDATRDDHTKWDMSERGANTLGYHFHVESKIWQKRTCLRSRNRIMDTEERLVLAKAERARGGVEWEAGVSR